MARALAATGLLLPMASALGFPGASHGPGFVSVPVAEHARDPGFQSLRRRATDKTLDIEMPTYGGNSGWVVNITIGDPGQTTTVSIDTGSTELWVDPDCDKAGTATGTSEDGSVTIVNDALHDPALCKARGRYDPEKSSTQKQANIPAQVFRYGDSTSATVNYYSDKLDFGGLTINDQIFGVANVSNQTGIGIMGMGPPPFGFNNSGFYTLILKNMADQGVINSPAFSLDLRSQGNSTGSLIFGGVDKGKYGGPLTKFTSEAVVRKLGDQSLTDYSTYWLKVSSLTLLSPNNTSEKKSISIPGGSLMGGLDCGSGAMLLPEGSTAEMCKDLNGKILESLQGTCLVDCSLRQLSGGLAVGLNGKDFTIGYDNLISQYGSGAQAACTLAVRDTFLTTYDPPIYMLGAPFLRAVYAVFDWDNEAVHLAEHASCGSNIVAIGSGTSAVPGGNGDCPSNSFATNLGSNLKLVVAVAVATWLIV